MRGRSFKCGRRGVRQQRGSVILLFAICLIVLIGVLGLAIDSSMAYFAKARLSLATDSAVLAAADVYSQAKDRPDDARQKATLAADSFFRANYPYDFAGTDSITGNLKIWEEDGDTHFRYVTQEVNPLTFARVLSKVPLKNNALAEYVIRLSLRNAHIVMLLDESTSITQPTWKVIVKSIEDNYIDKLDTKTTRIAMIPIADPDKYLDHVLPFCPKGICPPAPGFDPKIVKESLQYYVAGTTAAKKAFDTAVEQFQQLDSQVPQEKAQNIVLLVTDGGFRDDQKAVEEISQSLHENLHVDFYGIGWGPVLNQGSPKCIVGDPDNRVDDEVCATGVFRAYPGSRYCLGEVQGWDPDLDHCLIKASQQQEFGVLIR